MEKMREGESQKRDDAGARKGRKVVKHCVFPLFCGSEGRESRLAEAAVAEQRCQKSAVVGQSTCRSQDVQNTPPSDHLRKR